MSNSDSRVAGRNGPPPTGTDAGSTVDGISLVGMANTLLRHRKLLVLLPLTVVVAVAGITLLRAGRNYDAESRILPETGDFGGQQLMGMAMQLGFALPATVQQGETPQFLGELLRSRAILRDAARARYAIRVGGATVERTIPEILGWEQADAELAFRRAEGFLQRNTRTRLDFPTRMITLRTTAPHPDLAIGINAKLLELAEQFNTERRQSRASQERRFVETQLADAQLGLQETEAELERFMDQNRGFSAAPHLRFEAARLERRVELRQQVYVALAQAYENARIQEVRSIPVLTVVEAPRQEARSRRPLLVKNVIIAGALGLLVAIVLAFALDGTARQRMRNPEEFAEFDRLRRVAFEGLRRRSLAAKPEALAHHDDR